MGIESATGLADDITIWDAPQPLSDKLMEYANEKMSEALDAYPDAVEKVHAFKEAISSFLVNIKEFEIQTQQLLQTKGFNHEEVKKTLGEKVDNILEQLTEEFKTPLPENQDERYEQREEIVDWTLDKLETALVDVYRAYGVSELDTRAKFQGAKENIKSIVMIIGNVAEAHPELVEILIISGVCLLLPEAWIARPLMKAFGFVADVAVGSRSVAAWTQRTFYRVAIGKGSWFAWLQKAAMKIVKG
ncbi:hypothetical protein CPB83DRAFT_765014 [Crepidotus variabilis]|uniref:Uncharacterized protein n=1 Tax=Crepidotus variabilis TaxID=179855 RepID=A0A9P6JR14_9AGAR|nr:hypothetical protein CPB83DRAFT_765014 [Crepidotus variabilis]